MAILNYTTKIDADKTAGEIAKMLSKAGAQAVMTEFDQKENYVKTMSFRIELNGQMISFRLPCEWEPIVEILKNDKKVPRSQVTREQAIRVAWRIVKDWVEAQLALIQTQMVTTLEVFLPYAVQKNGQTLFQNIVKSPDLLLGNGN